MSYIIDSNELNFQIFKRILCKMNVDRKVRVIDERSSFVNRIYDDLCEDILQWLPVEDKIILSGVCRQFRRCLRAVRQRQQVLKLDIELRNDRNNLNIFMRHLSDLSLSEERKAKTFGRILTTFPNVNTIVFGKNSKLYMIEDLLLTPLINYCPRLESITFSPFNCSTKLVEDFAEHFGPRMKKVEFMDRIFMIRAFIQQSPGLQAIRFLNFKNLFDNNRQLLVSRVEKLEVFGVQNVELLNKLVETNTKLTHLEISLAFSESSQTSEALAILSKLKELRILKINLNDCHTFDKRIADNMEAIATNCRKLKSFGLEVEFRKSFDTLMCFQKLGHFSSSLTRLSLNSHDSSTPNPIPTQRLSSECLKRLPNLTHLELISDQIDDKFFVGLNQRTPLLKHLVIGYVHKKRTITDRCFESLAKLQHLESLSIKSLDRAKISSITDSGVKSLIKSCDRLQTLAIFNRIEISETTVDVIVDKATKNPQIYYNYYLRGIENFVELVNRRRLRGVTDRCLNVFITGSGQVFAKTTRQT